MLSFANSSSRCSFTIDTSCGTFNFLHTNKMDFNKTANFDMAFEIMSQQRKDDDFDDMGCPDSSLMMIPTTNLVHEDTDEQMTLEDMLNDSFDIPEDNSSDSNRFKTVSDEDLKKTLDNRVPKNTRKNTAFAMNTYKMWATFRNKQPETKQDSMGKSGVQIGGRMVAFATNFSAARLTF